MVGVEREDERSPVAEREDREHPKLVHRQCDGDEEYGDWAVTLSKTVLGLDVALMYSDTDLGNDCAYSSQDSCDSNVTLSVSKTL